MFHKGLLLKLILCICLFIVYTLMLISMQACILLKLDEPFLKYLYFSKECFSCRTLIFLYAKVDIAVGKAEESGPAACIMAW